MSKKIMIQGGKPLNGEINISGAKNAAVAIIPAAILVDGVCRLENIPNIVDVMVQLDIVKDKLFECLGEDNYIKADGIVRLLGDLLMWPVHFVKALLP